MTRSCAVLAVCVLLLACACHEADHMGSPAPVGALSYSAYDEAGRLVVRGWIWLDIVLIDGAAQAGPGVPTPLEFSGEWELRALVDPARVGPQNGKGTLAGAFVEDGVAVDLQPGGADDNVRLFGKLSGGGIDPLRYEGTWRWETLIGPRAEGTFVASR